MVSSVKVAEVAEKAEESHESQQVQSPGLLLRAERERRGLTHEDISERTKIRPQMIMAIEDEAWDRLPSPAFVRAFLRSYAKALSLDEEAIVGSYGKNVQLETELLSLRGEPLREKPRKSLFLLWLLAAVVALFVLWKMYGPTDSNLPGPMDASTPAPTVTAKSQTDVQPAPQPVAPETAQPALAAPPEKVEAVKPEVEVVDQPAERAVTVAAAAEPKPGPHQLKGKVNARTWAKIFVDDLEPREYMFQPGQQPKWSVSKGFYMIIGNAGGIELEWDGEAVSGLGTPGHVLRLRIPKDFRHRVEGN